MDDSTLYNAINNNSSSCGQSTNVYTNFITKFFSSCCRNETVIETVPRSTWIKYDGSTLYDYKEYYQQSDIQDMTHAAPDSTVKENVGFSDENAGITMQIAAPIRYTMSNSAVDAPLGEFLSRPVRLATVSWTLGNTISGSIYPWHVYFNTPAITEKIESYSLFRGNMKIKILVNASPFYYSAALFAYQPLTGLNPAIVPGAVDQHLVSLTQRPNITIFPQENQGGEMTLPFIYHKEWLNLTDDSDVYELGRIDYYSFDILRSANASAGATVSITVIGWMEDVELSGPTMDGVLQSKDEYSANPISKPASAIASATGMLGSLPVIGPFMTATSVAAGKIADVARIFGFSNPPNLAPTTQLRINNLPLYATTDIPVAIEKLTLDSKNELTIDPRVCGADVGDQMDFKSICAREAYLTSLDWATSTAEDVQLGAIAITPNHFRIDTTPKTRYLTPMSAIAQCYSNWRGTICVRLRFLTTQYHKGRVIITWDPKFSSVQTTYPKIYNHILDISTDKDIKFRVPWMQQTAYLPTVNTLATEHFSDDNTPLISNANYNGILTVRVYTQLTAPVQTAPIKVLVYVSAEDMDFIAPTDIPLDISPYAQQSKLEYLTDCKITDIGPPTITDNNINLVYGGEKISSIRTLIKRQTNYLAQGFATTMTGSKGYTTLVGRMNRRPLFPGYDGDGIHTAVALTGGGNVPYNFVNWTYMNWFEQCFVGQRGSINYYLNADLGWRNFFLTRDNEIISTGSGYDLVLTQSSLNTDTMSYHAAVYGADGLKGTSLNDNNRVILAQAPFYSRYKFLSTNPSYRTLGVPEENSEEDTIKYGGSVGGNQSSVSQSLWYFGAAAGLDYTLIFFLNAPIVYKYSSIPVPVTP